MCLGGQIISFLCQTMIKESTNLRKPQKNFAVKFFVSRQMILKLIHSRRMKSSQYVMMMMIIIIIIIIIIIDDVSAAQLYVHHHHSRLPYAVG